MLITSRFAGSLLGLTICSTVFTSMFKTSLSSFEDLPDQIATLNNASQAVGFIPRLREVNVTEETMRAVTAAYEKAFQTIWAVLAAFSALGALLSVLTKEYSRGDGAVVERLENFLLSHVSKDRRFESFSPHNHIYGPPT
ncbi:hypothetical protein ACJQWK_02676 [Exserohilum turcicum]